ncbi:sulfotransferase domain-containing protein [Kineosporia babensis]|uniref:Sulfotransferase n=1 Tax=Kineosporia babensis TaxID=499548 RepID=A0A9X1SXM8_9ACTN|nr:sulfotransferase domain-containing protein [Kineosporia babensis]MCD5315355.1 sulfotransferase [Kineosporia babensis]
MRVAFVGGVGRSGSTLIELALGQLPDACPLGEVRHLWQRGVAENQLCGCGEPFAACSFWKSVGEQAFGGWDQVDLAEVQQLKSAVDRSRHVPRLLLRPSSAVARYTELYRRIYTAAGEVSGRALVIDSSKHISFAACLAVDPEVDLRVLHVVRDPRGVAHSWSKQTVRPEVTSGDVYMPQYSAGHAALQWDAHNAMYAALRLRLGAAQRLLRYEDFVADPRRSLVSVAQFLEVEPLAQWQEHPESRVLELGVQHTVAGNPMRFTQGPVEVRADQSWRTGMPRAARITVTGSTFPLAWYYGYGVTG